MANINKEELLADIRESFDKLVGDYLYLAEGYFKDSAEKEKWAGFRKLELDSMNIHRRYIEAKLEGRNYYHMKVIGKREEK